MTQDSDDMQDTANQTVQNYNQHRMLIISTGGTIGGNVASDKQEGEDFEYNKSDSFAQLIKGVITSYKRKYKVEIVPIPLELYDEDSSDIKPQHWVGIAEKIYKEYDNYDSFVVAHGTNTMGYTTAALSFIFPNLGKPVIFTGSQVPIGLPGSDAQTNLENAVRLAALPPTVHQIRGVIVVFGSYIISGARVKKDTEFDYDAFKSFNVGAIGRVGRKFDIDVANLNTHLSYQTHMDWRVANEKSKLRFLPDFETNILSLTEYPGFEPELLTKFVDLGVKGFIIRAFGAGDMSTSFQDVLQQLKARKIPVVATTQSPNGRATMRVNEPGEYLLENGLAIPAHDMSIEAQTAKLMWLLAQLGKNEISFEQLSTQMLLDLRGEVQYIED